MDFLLFAVVQRVGVIPSGAAFQAEGGISHPRKAAAFPHPSASSADFLSALCVLRFEAAGKKSTQFEMTLDERYPKFKATHQPHYPALRSPGTSAGSSSHSNVRARALVSIGSSSGISSATDAPNSANLRAETSTRFSNDPIAWL